MTYTAPATPTTGTAITVSFYNTYIRDNIAHLRALLPDAAAADMILTSTAATTATFQTALFGRSCVVRRTANKSISHNTWTIVDFDAEISDDGGWHDNSTNNSRITVPSTGMYLVGGSLFWQSNSQSWVAAGFFKNQAGAAADGTAAGRVSQPYQIDPGQMFCIPMSLTAGDYLELGVKQSHGSSSAVNLEVQEDATYGWYSPLFWVMRMS